MKIENRDQPLAWAPHRKRRWDAANTQFVTLVTCFRLSKAWAAENKGNADAIRVTIVLV